VSTGLPSLPREVEALRSMLDARLNALESALADPTQHGSLQQLILDLARVATEEADAAARQACIEAERQGQGLAASVRAEARTAIQAEQAAALSLRQGLQQALTALETEKAAGAKREQELADLRRVVDQVRSELQTERSGAAGRERDLKQAVQSLEAEQAARATERRQLDEFQTELKSLRTAAARERELAAAQQALERELQNEQSAHGAVREQLQALQTAGESERAAMAQVRDTVKRMKGDLETALREVASARRETASARGDAETLRGELESARSELAAVRSELDSARHKVEAARGDGEARSQTLSQSQVELEKSLKDMQRTAREAQQALKAAEGKAAEADARAADAGVRAVEAAAARIADAESRAKAAQARAAEAEARFKEVAATRDALQAQLEAAMQTPPPSGEGDATDRDRYEALLAANEKQIRSLELAAHDAAARAEAAEGELRAMRRGPETEGASPGGSPAHASNPAAAGSSEAVHDGPVRGAKRVAISEQTEIQIDGIPAKLVDLSLTGAQILAPSALKPNRIMKLTIPDRNKVITCKGKIMWSRLETSMKLGGQLWYRGGLQFTAADQAAIQAFLNTHS
jgi:chromosome segregation ATPase